MPPAEPSSSSGLTVLMPAFNEGASLARSVAQVVDYLSAKRFDYEILIVDDASTDDTALVAQGLCAANPCVRLVRHEHNQGPCSGLRTGPAHASKPWLLLLPVDLAIPLNDIEALWSAREGCDVVLGYIAEQQAREPARRLQSKVYTLLVNALFGLALEQVNYVALYRTELLRGLPLTTSGVALHAEILVRAARAGGVIRQCGVGYEPRRAGAASGSKPTVIVKTLRELLGLRISLLLGSRAEAATRRS
ncbi:MAG: glycosyltransferase family 2 protein [Polyangiales bacterium]